MDATNETLLTANMYVHTRRTWLHLPKKLGKKVRHEASESA